ncbi:MAG: hypothetical protein KKC68_01985, partial [Candidatus Thermoplasmatota archaeon]|nr:hypothetical protein [Candidatus Thermoplasmatota archaeon]
MAVATDGGVSVINETDESVISESAIVNYVDNVFIANDATLYYTFNGSSDYRRVFTQYNITTQSNNWYEASDPQYWKTGSTHAASTDIVRILGSTTASIYDLYVTENTSTIDGTSNTIYVGSDLGLTVIQEKQGDESNGSVKYYTKDEITEEMVGDIRGAWGFNTNSTLADGNDVQDVSVKDADMTSVAGATVVDGVRGKAFQFNGSTQYLKQKVYEDETGANWGPTVHGLSLADGSAFAAVDNVNLAAYAGAANPYMLVMEDTEGDVAWGYIDTADEAEGLGSELLSNEGFETYTGTQDDGTSDTFTPWSPTGVNDPSGNKVEATATVNGGSNAVKLTETTSQVSIIQDFSVTAGKLYKVNFYTRGDGSNNGVYSFYDLTNGQSLMANISTGVSGTTYTEKSIYVTAPSGCSSIRIYLSTI